MLAVNQVLQNRYRIIRQLGEGGMGAVYEAEDNQRFGKKVALKEILLNLTEKNSEHFRRAFEREAKILTQIDHEAVPKVIGYILDTDFQILVMELIKGEDLDEILEREKKPFALKEVVGWTEQLLDALDYLHTLKQPIIHRDIKPQNLKLTKRGKIKLLDFGIAKDSEAEMSATKSRKTMIGATLYYSPIEQIIRIPDYFEMLKSVFPEKANKISRQAADARSDIYALGATLYQLLTNELPKPAHLRALEVWAGRADSLTPLQKLNSEISPEIVEVLSKAMAIERDDRFASAEEMQTALQDAVSHETRRKEAEARFNLLQEQEKIRREREELEAEKRKLAEERQRQQTQDTEAERKRREELEYQAKLEQWKRENLKEAEEKPITDIFSATTSPLVVNSERTAPELSQENELSESTEPSYLDGIEFESEKPKVVTIENKPQTAPFVAERTKPDKKKSLWILPVAFAAIFIFSIGAFGVFIFLNNTNGSSANKPVTNTQTTLPTALPTISPTPTPEPSVSPSMSPTTSPVQSIFNNEKPKPTVAPTTDKTTIIQNPVKTPIPKTPKPLKTPDRSDDCIYNGKCRN